MKTFWAALVAFGLLWGLAIWNCTVVCQSCEELLALEAALPEAGDAAEAELATLEQRFSQERTLLFLTVRRDQILAAQNALATLLSVQKSGEPADYRSARRAFREAIRAIWETEQPSAQSIL